VFAAPADPLRCTQLIDFVFAARLIRCAAPS
jgi:hypothetical protein